MDIACEVGVWGGSEGKRLWEGTLRVRKIDRTAPDSERERREGEREGEGGEIMSYIKAVAPISHLSHSTP